MERQSVNNWLSFLFFTYLLLLTSFLFFSWELSEPEHLTYSVLEVGDKPNAQNVFYFSPGDEFKA